MKRLAFFLIRIYRSVSRVFPSHCVYTPTCSEYAQQAFSRHPFFKALKFTLCRILRCNPFTKGGFDPVK
ncbi:MAG: membrane protein insertion efficiency factor YidD [Candidatus Omnitrophica bacterium]|nr:membrane protein insertion efficiency factor YidD [Candidatus Omnitrophota bacterium]